LIFFLSEESIRQSCRFFYMGFTFKV